MDHTISIGTAGWSYPDWKGIVYPRGTKDPLRYLARYVDCIEINSTFYRLPEQKLSQSWLDKTKDCPGFFFTAKLHSDFTHKGLADVVTASQFRRGYDPLLRAGKLSHLLIQFRYDFRDGPDNRRHLETLAKLFAPVFTLVIEVRHNSWQTPNALSFFENLNVTVANLDYPLGKDSFNLPQCIVGHSGYFRLHGRNAETWFTKSTRDEKYNYLYSPEELDEIQQRTRNLAAAYPSLVVITNNHYQGAEVANALELKARITGQKVLVPEDLLLRYPRLEEIAKNRPLF